MKWRDAIDRVMGQLKGGDSTPGVSYTPVTRDETLAAVFVLYGARVVTRKRQRKRTHITYAQRDQIAHLLLRMQSQLGERSHEP